MRIVINIDTSKITPQKFEMADNDTIDFVLVGAIAPNTDYLLKVNTNNKIHTLRFLNNQINGFNDIVAGVYELQVVATRFGENLLVKQIEPLIVTKTKNQSTVIPEIEQFKIYRNEKIQELQVECEKIKTFETKLETLEKLIYALCEIEVWNEWYIN